MKKLFTAFLMLASIHAMAQGKKAANDPWKNIDQELNRLLEVSKAPSFSVAVVKGKDVLYSRGFGLIDVDNKIPATPNSIYAIGSCSKAFTSALIGLLESEKLLDIDKPIRNYLPELTFYNDNMNAHITLRDMMCHRTGLPRHDLSWYLFPTTRDSLIKRIAYQEPTFEPREKWQYNNFMFLAQGVVAEKLYKKSWEQLVKEKFFDRLGMKNSGMTNIPFNGNKNLAVPYQVEKDSTWKKLDHYLVDGLGPAGSIYSSVTDMSEWVKAWINNGKKDSTTIIPAGYRAQAISPQMIASNASAGVRYPDVFLGTYGFGWFASSYKGHYMVEHGGNIDGFSANTSFFPTDSIGVVVLTNQNGSWVPNIARNIIVDQLLKLQTTNWIDSTLKDLRKRKAEEDSLVMQKSSNRKKIALTHPLPDYEGIYNHPGYGNIDVFIKGDSLKGYTGKYDIWFEHWHYDVFVPYFLSKGEKIDTTDRPNGVRVQFNMDVNGDISSLNLFGVENEKIKLEFKRKPKAKPLDASALQDFTGTFTLGSMDAKVLLKKDKLYLSVPGQPEYELLYLGNDLFKLLPLEGFSMQFHRDEKNKVTAASFIQPNGTFKATKK